ncbi:hypothetical protein BDB00DRAFT_785080 [Zychaea mexicana]|uniref:uncharacterized protein n=1 Tax=Zychaea mexicana TaxID=64656 RepID=UPI0022FE2C84|nr:uncharacterized protein BDB00DRAFT_785080 [Zychaea mexicana]KAI9496972.1 hypothetical protein BDB00DRAFT_785080 [Zychaea mexicana]
MLEEQERNLIAQASSSSAFDDIEAIADLESALGTGDDVFNTTTTMAVPAEDFRSEQKFNGEEEENQSKESIPRPEALFLHGLDEMSTKDIRAYCSNLSLEKIEWINDTSCNLVFANKEAVEKAIEELLVSDIEDPVTHRILRKARAYTQESSGHVFDNLHIRIATDWDVKERGARDRSRYYLLHGGDSGPAASSRLPDLPKGGVFNRLGRRNESRPQGRRGGRQRQEERRSLSPQPRRSDRRFNDDGTTADDDSSIQVPDSLKGRIGPRRPR